MVDWLIDQQHPPIVTLSPHGQTFLVLSISVCPSSLPHADVAPPDALPLLPALGQRGGGAVGVRGGRLHAGQPEAVDVGEVVAGSSGPLTLHEGLGPEVRQTAT